MQWVARVKRFECLLIVISTEIIPTFTLLKNCHRHEYWFCPRFITMKWRASRKQILKKKPTIQIGGFIFCLPIKKRNPPRIPPAPSCGAEAPDQKTFQKISLGFANPPPAKLLRKTESACVFSVSPPFPFLESSVLRTEARSARGTLYSFLSEKCSSVVI